jgi:hypothetical protein
VGNKNAGKKFKKSKQVCVCVNKKNARMKTNWTCTQPRNIEDSQKQKKKKKLQAIQRTGGAELARDTIGACCCGDGILAGLTL